MFDSPENSLLALLDNYESLKKENEQLKQELSKCDKALGLARDTLRKLAYLGGLRYEKHSWIAKALAAINEVLGGNSLKEYGDREYCKATECMTQELIDAYPEKADSYKGHCCHICRAYEFHDYLQKNGYKIVKEEGE